MQTSFLSTSEPIGPVDLRNIARGSSAWRDGIYVQGESGVAISSNENRQPLQGISRESRFLNALNRFTNGLSTEVRNPLKEKYGKAYDHLISGDACRYREDIETAMFHYRRALSYRRDFTEAYLGLAKCLRREGDTQGAIRCLERGLKDNNFHKELHLDIAKCYAESAYIKQAIHHYEWSIRLDRSSVEARFGLALVVETNDDAETAIRLYQEILNLDPEFLPAYNNLGSLYMRSGLLDEAEMLFRSLVEKAPDFTRGYLGLAMTLDRAGKAGAAIEAYQKVMKMRPEGKNNDFIEQRIIQMNCNLGRTKTRHNLTLVRIK